MEPNHLTAIIGVIMLTLAGTGLAVIEENPKAPTVTTHKYHLTWQMAGGAEVMSAGVTDGTSQQMALTIKAENVTVVALAAKWVDHPPSRFASAASVSISLTDPNGTQAGTAQGTDGGAGLGIDAGVQNEVPKEANISASSLSKAWDVVLVKYPPATKGTGAWKITISTTRGGFHPLRSGSVTVDIVLEYITYKADLKEAVKG